jgi:thioredoxin 1
MSPSTDSASHWWVICLCAEWCGVCREWREAFTQAAAAHPEFRFAWVDVEDEADAMGDVDIETFPTVLIAREGQPLFFGPVLPSGTKFTRLIASLQDAVATGSVSREAAPLLERLVASVLPKP